MQGNANAIVKSYTEKILQTRGNIENVLQQGVLAFRVMGFPLNPNFGLNSLWEFFSNPIGYR